MGSLVAISGLMYWLNAFTHTSAKWDGLRQCIIDAAVGQRHVLK